ncbi:hypothetical protein E4T46_01650 [Aureobasidium subglaciale]|nr:hypothetical protein E4T40_01653 [Aureobasidium subglaciale]KAI5266289.1 hypothetical protein E4T46_01650 [Aureobasidium subglaciale]
MVAFFCLRLSRTQARTDNFPKTTFLKVSLSIIAPLTVCNIAPRCSVSLKDHFRPLQVETSFLEVAKIYEQSSPQYFTATEIAQLYIHIPDDTQPTRQLRGFDKRTICVGETLTMIFELKRRDFSIWNVEVAEWQLLEGTYELFVGASSRDLRLRGEVVLC